MNPPIGRVVDVTVHGHACDGVLLTLAYAEASRLRRVEPASYWHLQTDAIRMQRAVCYIRQTQRDQSLGKYHRK